MTKELNPELINHSKKQKNKKDYIPFKDSAIDKITKSI